MDKYQKALDWSYHNLTDIHEEGKNELSIEAIKHLTTIQELIDICLKPNSIKLKLDHIQDAIDCCYETDDDGNIVKSEFNYDLGLADEYLQDIKQAYSFRVEDTRIVNELQELFGGCCVDNIKKKVQELMDDLELYKKALEILVQLYEGDRLDLRPFYKNDNRTTKDLCLEVAREELENGK